MLQPGSAVNLLETQRGSKQTNKSAKELWRLLRNYHRIKILFGDKPSRRTTTLIESTGRLTARKSRNSILTQLIINPEEHKSTRTLTTLQFFLNQTLIPFILFYCVIIIPYRFAFRKSGNVWVNLDASVDIFLIVYYIIIYLIKRFRITADPHKQAITNTRWPFLGIKYFFFWKTLICILFSVPWELMNHDLIIIKVFHVFWLKKWRVLARRLLCQNRWSNRMLLKYRILRPLRNLIVSLLISLHLMACGWIRLSKARASSWIYEHIYQEEIDAYIEALMFMTERVSSVGFGEVAPAAVGEYFFQMLLQFVATYFYTRFFLQLTYLSERFEVIDNPKRKEQEDLLSWTIKFSRLSSRKTYRTGKFSEDLANFYFEGKWLNIQDKTIKDKNYVSLPFEIQSRLTQYLFREVFAVFAHFFDGLTEEFRNALVTEMLPFSTSEALFGENHQCDAVYFLCTGTIRQLSPKDGTEVKLHHPGAVLGYNYILLNKKPMMVFKPAEIVSGFCIPKSVFIGLAKVQFKNMMTLKRRAMATFILFHKTKTLTKPKFPKIQSLPVAANIRTLRFEYLQSIFNSDIKSRDTKDAYEELPMQSPPDSCINSPNASFRGTATQYDLMLGNSLKVLEEVPRNEKRSLWPDSSPNKILSHGSSGSKFSQWSTSRPQLKLSDSHHPMINQDDSLALEMDESEKPQDPQRHYLDSPRNHLDSQRQHLYESSSQSHHHYSKSQSQSYHKSQSQKFPRILQGQPQKFRQSFASGFSTQKRTLLQKFETSVPKSSYPRNPLLTLRSSFGYSKSSRSIQLGSREYVSQIIDEDVVEEEGEPESDSDNDELNSSLEIPIVSVRDDEMLFDSQFFDLSEICAGLEGKKIEVEQKFRKLVSKLKVLSSQTRKASAHIFKQHR